MKKVKSTMIAIVATAFSIGLAAGQQGPGEVGGPGPDRQEIRAKLEKISAELNLTPQQKLQLLPILKEEAPELKAVKENASLGPIQKARQLRQISMAIDAKVLPILNPTQQEKWQAMRERERQEMIQKLQQK
jgi:periplasmic protein CpxP/Spy